MVEEKILKELDNEIRPDNNYAQIIVGMNTSSKTAEEAKKMIEGMGVSVIETRHISCSHILV